MAGSIAGGRGQRHEGRRPARPEAALHWHGLEAADAEAALESAAIHPMLTRWRVSERLALHPATPASAAPSAAPSAAAGAPRPSLVRTLLPPGPWRLLTGARATPVRDLAEGLAQAGRLLHGPAAAPARVHATARTTTLYGVLLRDGATIEASLAVAGGTQEGRAAVRLRLLAGPAAALHRLGRRLAAAGLGPPREGGEA
jgi:hypothetical protein